jgi:acylphosphatase
MNTRTIQVRIEGQVQCVGFRAFVEMNAIDLGLVGWVRNRQDGSVEAVFQGAVDAVETMLQRCQAGPPASAVTGVKLLGEGAGSFNGFSVRRTV